MDNNTIYQELIKTVNENIVQKNADLKEYTFTKTGGNADILVFPTTYDEAQKIVSFAYQQEIPLTILGNGSNVIIKDGGIRGIVLNLLKLNIIGVVGKKITAQSGAAIMEVSQAAYNNSLTGLEFACGIPGTVGGALYMNAGAYGGEVSHVFEKAVVLNRKGELLTMNKDDLGLKYRSSNVEKENYVVLEVTFSLQEADAELIKEKMIYLTYLRQLKQPLEYPSCGSVFKRPPNHYSGKLIQDSGLQGEKIGGAQVSTKHAGFIVNVGGATATDYIKLIQLIQKKVKEKFEVELETEVKIIGED